jgi:hypothetical protein
MNWGECKLYALQKIDPTVNSLVPNRNTSAYLNAIVAVANRGLQDLATTGKFITRSFDITQSEPKNILPMPLYLMEIYDHNNDDVPYEANGATSYYFEVDGTATVQIYVDGVLTDTIQNTTKGFTAYKGFISNPSKKTVKIVFGGLYHYQYRNIALYDANFETVSDIWDFVSEKRYNLKTLLNDFYKLVTTDIVLQSGFNQTRYAKTSEYYWEGDSTLVLNGCQKGSWKVHYYAYPQEITTTTADSEELSLDHEVAALLPVYIAAELMEDDEIDKAYYFRQQYDEGKQRLRPTQSIGKAQFVDANGW